MRKTSLTELDRSNLEEVHKNHGKAYVRNRAHSVLLNADGFKVKEIAKMFRVRTRTIYQWFDRWESSGYLGLLIDQGRGRKASLNLNDNDTLAEIKKSR